MIYYKMPDKILNNGSITESGCKCFASLVYYIIDYLRLSGDPAMKSKIIYFSSMYYQINLLCKDPTTSSVLNRALKLSGLSENAASMVDLVLESVKDEMKVDEKEEEATIEEEVKDIIESEEEVKENDILRGRHHNGHLPESEEDEKVTEAEDEEVTEAEEIDEDEELTNESIDPKLMELWTKQFKKIIY